MFDRNKAMEMFRAWLKDCPESDIIEWDSCIHDAVLDAVNYQTDDAPSWEHFADLALYAIENVKDDPERYGVSFPVYNSDIVKVWDYHSDDVQECADAIEAEGTIMDIMTAGVCEYVYQDAQNVLYEIMEGFDKFSYELEEVLGVDEDEDED